MRRLLGVAGTAVDVKARMKADSNYYYDPAGGLIAFSANGLYGRNCKKYPDAEYTSGEWSTIDLYCFKGTSVYVVNNKVNMILHNSRHWVDGEETPLMKGKIELQSESAEIFYKNIKVRPISALRENY